MTDVTIVGLLPQQANLIQKQYEDRLDMNFLEAKAPVRRLQSTADSSDQVILMTKFIPHETQRVLRSHEGLTFCNGGLSSLRNSLDRLL